MAKEQIIQHIALMLKYLDEEGIRAVYMIVKALYTKTQNKQQGQRPY